MCRTHQACGKESPGSQYKVRLSEELSKPMGLLHQVRQRPVSSYSSQSLLWIGDLNHIPSTMLLITFFFRRTGPPPSPCSEPKRRTPLRRSFHPCWCPCHRPVTNKRRSCLLQPVLNAVVMTVVMAINR